MKIVFVNHGLANFYGDRIEVNRKLAEDAELLVHVLNHELGHSSEFDFGYEAFEGANLLTKNPRIFFKLIKFMIKTPSTWIDLSPIQYRNKKFVFDVNLILIYLFGSGFLTLLIVILYFLIT